MRLNGYMMLVVLASMMALAGCQRPLFPDSAQRTPYDRYMALRGEQRQLTEATEFGRERPALRERLKPLGQP